MLIYPKLWAGSTGGSTENTYVCEFSRGEDGCDGEEKEMKETNMKRKGGGDWREQMLARPKATKLVNDCRDAKGNPLVRSMLMQLA